MVKRDPPVAVPQAPQETGLIFECVAETHCPQCRAAVPLGDAKPLSVLACPACGSNVLVPGKVGGFLLHGQVGEGGMGTIYRATDEALKRDVAIKLVRGCHVDDPESCERLRQEACAAGKLNHPRVAQVHALNFSNGHPYLVMELVPGQNFAQMLERDGHIEERVVLRMALDVAEGLSALNREGLVHGDIKPDNIVLDRDGNAKLVDFGLSGMKRRDSHGTFMGTPNYIAPELLRGSADTHRSDLYSLGATLYHLLAGRPPNEGATSADVIKARLSQQPVPLGKQACHVSMLTRNLVMRMLEINPDKRQKNSDVVAAEIRAALARLDLATPVASSASGWGRRFYSRLEWALRPKSAQPTSRRYSKVTVILGLVAAAELFIFVRKHSFGQSFEWLRRDFNGPAKSLSAQESASQPAFASSGQDAFALAEKPLWNSMSLGERAQRGSTMQVGETLVVQGTGTDMWKGCDCCRFVWTKVSENYVFSAHFRAIANNHAHAITGLLVKGDDPSHSPGLLFGFLGSGELFLQVRQLNGRNVVVKRSEAPVLPPRYLKLMRRGYAFEAYFSADGHAWEPFASCELDLPAINKVGFAVTAQVPDALATAKFSSIRLLTPNSPAAAQTNGVPAASP